MPGLSIFQRRRWLAFALILLAGCSGGKAASPTAVAGKVSYRGKPLSTGTIVFVPDSARGTSGPPLCAAIQPSGTYRLEATGGGGVPAGWYRVTVAAVDVRPAAPGTTFGTPYSLLPDKYRDPEVSGLLCEVKSGRENAIHFNLE